MDSLIGVEESVEFVAPAAPIGAELEKNNFVIFFGPFESRGELLLGIGGFVVDGRSGHIPGMRRKAHQQTQKYNRRRTSLHSFSSFGRWLKVSRRQIVIGEFDHRSHNSKAVSRRRAGLIAPRNC